MAYAKLISVLFDKGRSTITEHLKNIFDEGELDEQAVCRDFRPTGIESSLLAKQELSHIISGSFHKTNSKH